jgi:hypothetical protein
LAAAAGTNRLLILAVGAESTTSGRILTSVTYGGQAMTLIAGVEAAIASPNYERSELWYLNEVGIAAASGSSFVFTWNVVPNAAVMYTAGFFGNVNQSTPIGNTNTNTSAATPITLSAALNVTQNDYVIVTASCGNSGSFTPHSGYTENADFTAAATATTTVETKAITVTGTEQPGETFSGAVNRQTIVGAVIKGALSSPPTYNESSLSFKKQIL